MEKSKDINERVANVARYIEQNLDKPLVLEELASIASFSPFHFQRIFKETTGETPKQFITRLRLEEAAHRIVLYPEKSMIEVALAVGFQSLEAFSRGFKNYYQISPSHFKNSEDSEKLAIIQNPDFKKEFLETSFLASHIDKSEFKDVTIEVVKRQSQKAVYMQTTLASPDLVTEGFKKIKKWALARELSSSNSEVFGIIKDYPFFTPLDKCRYLVCVEVNAQAEPSGMVNYIEIPSRIYATFKAKGSVSEVMKTLAFFAHYWLPESGYQVAHGPAIEVPLNDPLTTPFVENEYQLYIQIQPA